LNVLIAWPLPCRLWTNMTSSTKPEVHNLLHCRQRTAEPRPHVTCTENFVKFKHVVFEIIGHSHRQTYIQTDRQTDKRPHRNTSHLYRGRSKKTKHKAAVTCKICVLLCTSVVHNTIQNSSYNLPLALQTVIIVQMLSTEMNMWNRHKN